jgi:type IV secretory pathway TraG/TraD family ATPase VirD4
MARKPPLSMTGMAQGALTFINLANALTPATEATPPPVLPPDPMDGLAVGSALSQYEMRPGSFYLGNIHDDHKVNFSAGINDDRHVFVIAGSRAGKGISFGIPNALTWPGPVFMIDPKGEAASITAMRRGTSENAKGTGTSVRHFLGQKVAVLDPLGQVRGPARALRVQYNPLADIDMNRGGGVRQIQAAASAIITSETGNGVHFAETAETILAGVIEAVKLCEPPGRQTLNHCRNLILAGREPLIAYLREPAAESIACLAAEAATVIDEVGQEEWGSHRSTLSRNLKWLSEPDMQTHLEPSAFSLRRAVQEGWSIFVALPPDDIPRFKSWLRLIVRVVLDAKMSLGINQTGPQMLCLLDEFPTLGRFKAIEESAGYMAGYGLKLVPIIQNIGQVQEHYGKNWETFLGNAGAIIAFGLNTKGCEEYIASRLGRIMVTETTHSRSSGISGAAIGETGSNSNSWNTGRHERPVRFPNEIHDQGARETWRAFVIPASGKSFTVRRNTYANFPAGLFDSPDFISQWETMNWK